MKKRFCCLMEMNVLVAVLLSVTVKLSDGLVCNGTNCPLYAFCNGTECQCPKNVTSLGQSEVCGSDGQTYSSKEALQHYACTNGLNVFVSRKGPCLDCGDLRCHNYTYCDKKSNVCLCSGVPEIYGPVCGSDGKTYTNSYQLSYVSCVEARNITVAYNGFCKGVGVCGHPSCHKYSLCDNVTNRCICGTTYIQVYKPVCGTDNSTYGNIAELRSKACLRNLSIEVEHDGQCRIVTKIIRQMDENLYYIILPTIGGFVLLVVIILTIIYCIRRRRDRKADIQDLKLEYEVPLM